MGQNSHRKQRQRQFYTARKNQGKDRKLLKVDKGKDKDRIEIVNPGAS
jgi:hypothetical protein